MMTKGEKALLNAVLEHAGDMEGSIQEGIKKALRDIKDRARRTYLWNLLTRKAKEAIRRAKQKRTAVA